MSEPEKKRKLFHGRQSFKKYGSFSTYINLLIGYMDTVVLLNFFFILTSLGVITIGPGLLSMNQVYNDIIDNRTQHRYRAYFRYFKEDFRLSYILFGLLFVGCLCGLAYGGLFAFMNLAEHVWVASILVLVVFFMCYLSRVAAFFFLQTARMELPFKTILSNSFKLASGSLKCLALSDLSFLVLLLLPALYIQYTFPYLIIIGFGWLVLSCMMSVYGEVDPYVLKKDDDDGSEVKEEDVHLRLDLLDKEEKNPVKK
jgi:hypothetical protein